MAKLFVVAEGKFKSKPNKIISIYFISVGFLIKYRKLNIIIKMKSPAITKCALILFYAEN